VTWPGQSSRFVRSLSPSRHDAGIVTLEPSGRNQDGVVVAVAVRQVKMLREPGVNSGS